MDLKKDRSDVGRRIVRAFANCPKLERGDFSACTQFIKMGVETFSNCTGLKLLKLPENLTEISSNDFSGCTNLTSAVFEDKTGWAVYDNDTYTGTSTPVNLDDASTAAQYLRVTYIYKYWKKR